MSPNRWPMERRASSILPNPFWPDKTKQNCQLEAAKPLDLPKVSSEGEDTSGEGSVMSAKPVEDVTRGKGKGVSRNEHRNESRERRFEESKYKTPPSEREGVTGGSGRQNEGRMKDKTGKGRGEKREREEPLELKRELEKEMVMLLRHQNAKLMAEVEKLKARNAQTQASDQSWSAARQKHHSQSHHRHAESTQHSSQVHTRRDKSP